MENYTLPELKKLCIDSGLDRCSGRGITRKALYNKLVKAGVIIVGSPKKKTPSPRKPSPKKKTPSPSKSSPKKKTPSPRKPSPKKVEKKGFKIPEEFFEPLEYIVYTYKPNEELEEKYIKYIAKLNNVDVPTAIKEIDEYIKDKAADINLEYPIIYNTIFSEENIGKCLVSEKVCSALTVEECTKSCSCFFMDEYGCISRQIPDAEEINRNPDEYISKHLGKTEDLRRMVKIAAYLYYNYDGGGLSDNAFDALEYTLNKREKLKGRAYEKIGAEPIDKIRKKLPYNMGSLDKIYPDQKKTLNFILSFYPDKDCMWSLKLDGSSGMLVYKDRKLNGIYTRGNGVIGGDVTYLKDYVNFIPKEISDKFVDKGDFVVRGEFVLSKKNWRDKYQGTYANTRSFVSAKINTASISVALKDIDFVAYELKKLGDDKEIPQPTQAFKILESEGFQVVDYGLIQAPTIFDIIELYKNKRESSEYDIDGLVLQEDVETQSAQKASDEVSNPKDIFAFKMLLEEQKRDTKVIDIEWRISRHGRYVPVAIYESVYVNGVRMHKASLHNARHVQDWSLGVGTQITVYRTGDVIPQIKDVIVDETIEPIYPSDKYDWHWEGVNIVLDEIETNPDVLTKRLLHFFETLEVPKIGPATVAKFYNNGFTTPEEIMRSNINELAKIKGISKVSATRYFNDIKQQLMSVPLDRIIVASTTLKSGVGRKFLKKIFREFSYNIIYQNKQELVKTLKSKKIPGVGPKTIEKLSEGIPEFKEYLDNFPKEYLDSIIEANIKRVEQLEKKGYNPKIMTKSFVLTGFLNKTDYKLEDFIFDNRGEIKDSVISSVEAVITGNPASITDKMTKASSFHIPVLTIEEFYNRYKTM